MPISPDAPVQVLLPVHNEAEGIERTIRELYETLSRWVRAEFIVCEDGSTDGTREILQRVARELPITLVLGEERKGYSRAVIDGLRVCTAPYVLCIDSDGQCDPRDFVSFLPHIPAADVVIGWRVRRQDSLTRRVMSGSFRVLYRVLLGVRLHDPSCPYILVGRRPLDYLLAVPTLGTLTQGFWWEVVARLQRAGFSIVEVLVNHRRRASGRTQVYRPSRLPGIVLSHVWGLAKIRREPPAQRPRPKA